MLFRRKTNSISPDRTGSRPRSAPEWRAGNKLVDVREANETAAERIPGAVAMLLSRPDPAALSRRDMVLTCLSGKRSAMALARCREAGVAVNMRGGLTAWKAAKLTTDALMETIMHKLFSVAAVVWALAAPAHAQAPFTVGLRPMADQKAVFATVESPNVVPARTRIGGTVASLVGAPGRPGRRQVR